MRLAVIVPTRGRPDNIRKVLAAWDFTNAWEAADLVLAVDEDDPEYHRYRALWEEGNFRDFTTGEADSKFSILPHPLWRPMVAKLDTAAVALAESRLYSAIAFAGDDHLPRTINWAQRYLTVLGEMGTGMVYGDDGYQGEKLSTEWAVTADAVRALGRMVPAPVDHLYCDNAIMDLYGGAGALRHLPEIRIEHMHPVAGKAQSDAQYDRVNGREQYRGDRAQYDQWKTVGLPGQIEIIRKLRADRPEEKRPARAVRPQRQERAVRGSGPRPVQRSGPSRFSAPPKSRFPFPAAFRNVRGATPDEIAFTLADFAKAVPADQEIVELGVFQARTALIMAWGAAQGDGAHVTAIDLWDSPGNTYGPPFTDPATREAAEANVRGLGYSEQIQLVQAPSTGRTVDLWNTQGPNRPIGLLFVDDDHSAEGARNAIASWAPHLAPGAVIAVDDYGHPDWPGVAEAVDALVDEGFLAPIEIFHDRLAVTKLAGPTFVEVMAINDAAPITAITSEGVAVSRETEPDDGLDALTLGELRRRVKTAGHTGFSGLSKAELIALLRDGQ